jgi:hypothetical protein
MFMKGQIYPSYHIMQTNLQAFPAGGAFSGIQKDKFRPFMITVFGF